MYLEAVAHTHHARAEVEQQPWDEERVDFSIGAAIEGEGGLVEVF